MYAVSLFTFLCGILILLIGYRVLLLDSKNKVFRLFFSIALLCSWMCYGWYEMARTDIHAEAVFFFRLKGVWVFVYPLLILLLWYYSGFYRKNLPKWLQPMVAGLLWVPAIAFFYLEVFTPFAVSAVVPLPPGQWGLNLANPPTWTILRSLWLFIITAFSIYLVFYFYHNGTERKSWKRNALILFTLCMAGTLVKNDLLPYWGYVLPINESIPTLVGVGLFGWLVIGFRLSELQPEKGMDKVINAMTNLMILINEDYIIQRINPAALSFFQTQKSNVLGQPLQLLLGENTPEFIQALNQVSSNKIDQELSFQQKGRRAYLLLSASPIYRRQKLLGYALVGADLTEHRLNEQKLSLFTQKIQQSDEQIKHFAYITSHDLKEPLRNISNYTTKLARALEPQLQGQLQDYFSFITEGVRRMYNIIESIKDVSDIHYNEQAFETIDTSQLIVKIENRLQKTVAQKNATIHRTALPKIKGNPDHFELLFFNLIENGLKYNQNPSPQVYVGCQKEEGHFVFSITDNGIGIEPGFSEYVFKMFKRLHSRAQYEGVGMGLAICKSVVEKNGGQIWAETNPQGGTTIKFTLPQYKDNSYVLVQRKPAAEMI